MSGSTGTTGTGSGSTTGAGLNLGTESSLSNWAGDYVTNMLGQGQALANTPYEAYNGPLSAGTSALQNQAFSGLANLAAPGTSQAASNSAYGQANKLVTTGYSPGWISNTYNSTGSYLPSSFTNQYTATDPYKQSAATNQYTATDPYKQSAATNQYTATDPYSATTFTANALNANDIKNYMSGFDTNALQPQIAEARRQAKIDQLANSAALSKAGAWGGSSSLLSELQSQRNLQARLESITATGYKDAYDRALTQFNTDQNRNFEAQKASEASKQFGADQALKNAANTAQYGQSAQELAAKENQFAANQALTNADKYAAYGQSAQELAAKENQFGASQAAANAAKKAEYGLAALQEAEKSRQFATNTALTNADKAAYYGLTAQQDNEKNRQFAANYGLSVADRELAALKAASDMSTQGFNNSMALNKAMQDAGAQQRAITQEGINADKAQFLEEQQYPYKQVQFLQSLLSGMPLEAQQNTYSTPSALSDILATSGTFLDLMNKAVPSTTTQKAP